MTFLLFISAIFPTGTPSLKRPPAPEVKTMFPAFIGRFSFDY